MPVIPVKAAVGFLLSVGASLGLVVAVFQGGRLADVLDVPHSGPVVSFLPVILTGVLSGQVMDYEVFLASGVHEEWAHTGRARRPVVDGARHSVRVVTRPSASAEVEAEVEVEAEAGAEGGTEAGAGI
ncbi:hypothetical protein [Streptomyces sp. NBC_00576]|uniref:hypothetical protein n=1 Tax=Streptomyces sp. NBC_00576 TaxID=2903665 RepID=UPI002E819320|nr:hypothetical protein [Streptomyces sp. NBC_00576]